MRRLSKSASRLAALTLLAMALAALALGVAMPLAQRFDALALSLEEQRLQLRDYAAFAAQQPQLEALEERHRAELERGEFLAGEGELEWRFNLQGVLTKLAEESGVRISSARQLPDGERGAFKLVGMGLNLTSDIETVQGFLHAVEAARPYLFVESADISPLGGGGQGSGPRLLEVRLDIFAAPLGSAEP
ncbi:MAG TPA: type II secretion system protein GspM [Afifellaceae bacterium]|nr:type II secretion system protein GspM [Afifellaceae bacterium]